MDELNQLYSILADLLEDYYGDLGTEGRNEVLYGLTLVTQLEDRLRRLEIQ